MSLPNPGMTFTPFDTLTAAEQNDLVENIEALANGTGLDDTSITPAKLQSGTGTSWGWQSWTPSWVNLTIGNAVVSGKYIQIGKTVLFNLAVIFGTTSAMGTLPTFTLPVTSVTPSNVASLIASGNFSSKPGWATWNSTTTAMLRVWDANNDLQNITPTLPFTWGNGSTILLHGFYQAL